MKTTLRHHDDAPEGGASPRLNLLLSYGGWRERPTVEQLARLLEPHGINSVRADSGEEAAALIRDMVIHIAIVDLSIPLRQTADDPASRPSAPGGGRILQMLRRLEHPPPTVIGCTTTSASFNRRARATNWRTANCPCVGV